MTVSAVRASEPDRTSSLHRWDDGQEDEFPAPPLDARSPTENRQSSGQNSVTQHVSMVASTLRANTRPRLAPDH